VTLEIGEEAALELHNLANVERRAGNSREAIPLFKESLVMFHGMNSKRHVAYCFMGLGNVAAREGQPELAARFLGFADALFEATGVALTTSTVWPWLRAHWVKPGSRQHITRGAG